MRKKIRTLFTSPWAASLLYRLVRVYCLTLRLKVENEEPWLDSLKGGGKVLLCVWHQQFFALIRHFERYRAYRPSIMISQSQDGELIAAVAERCGWRTVRGSSSRGGGRALKQLIENLIETGLAAHILDGPRGPRGKVKSGVIHLAQATGAAIVPVCVEADKAWYFNSWDRFLLPKPFSRVTLRFGDMSRLAFTENPDERERQRRDLENVMKPYLKPQP